MSNFIDINEAARLLHVCTKTLKRWEKAGRITSYKTPGGYRRYDPDLLKRQVFGEGNKTTQSDQVLN